ncbi:MAG TPA: VWA domain-containing protein [Bryobacteraceae bacterium]|nr:VWA domain-containing protein [Bryobacteraceae bacterium]
MTRSTVLGILVFSPCLFAFQPPAARVAVTIDPRFDLTTTSGLAHAPEARLRVDSALALIPVHVTTADGTTVTNLARDNFEIFEDGVQQKISHFSKDDAPVSIGLVFDTSGSMNNKMHKSAEAAATFFKTANSDDEFFLVEFNDRPKLTVPFTPDSDLISRRISHTRPFGRTSLLDAIHLAMLQMKNAHNLRKALVILSDGGDNRSRFSASEVKNAMLESDVQLYAMGIFDLDDLHKHPIEEQNGPQLLEELAEQTGGAMYTVDNLDQLEPVSERISRELRSQYLLGYSPSDDERDGKFRRVKVKLNAPELPNLRTYFRHGYYAPAQ